MKDMQQMIAQLQSEIARREKTEEELRKANAFLNSIVENIPHMIFVKEATDLRFERFNAAGEALLGRRRDELIGKNDYDVFPKTQAQFFIEKDLEVLNQKKPLDISEEVIETPRGARILHTQKIPILDAEGHPKYLLGISEDITDHKRTEAELWALNQMLEKRVEERTAAAEERSRQLAQSNEELERFAYVASHDLQEPLRMVGSYVQLLERRCNNDLSPEAHEFIQFAVDGVNRMRRLINGLLDYSRIGLKEKPLQPIDAKAVLDITLENLKITLQEKHAEITTGPLPKVLSDSIQLAEIFQNLIGNAVKFCRTENPRVHIEAESQNGECIFRIRDNGIGIEPKDATRIFEIFQRLHPSGTYPGTGLGLAICKKIVERQGGRIWVESEPGKGSTFHFSLAAA